MGIDLGSINARLSLNINNFSANLRRAEEEIRQTERSFSGFTNIGKRFSDVGDKLTKAFTVPIVGAGVAATKFAMDFETGMAKVSTIADTSKISMDKLKEGVVDLSNDTGTSTTELNEALYQTISAGVDTANSVEFLGDATKTAKAGFTDSSTAIDVLTTTINAYGLKAKDATKISDQLMVAQNSGKTTIGEMGQSLGNVIPIASSVNVSTKELFASIATLTKNGIKTAQAITGLKAAYSNIIKPSKQASELAEKLGINFNAAHLKSVGWAKFLQEIKEKTHGNTEQMGQLFGSVEALNSVMVLTGKGSKDFNDILGQMQNSAGLTDEAFKKVSETTQEKFNRSLNKLKNSAMELGVKLLPILEKFAQFLSNLADKFSGLSPKQQDFIVKAGFMTAALGPLLSVGGRLFSGVSKLAGGIKTITSLFGIASTATTGTALATEGAAVATGGLGTAIGGALIPLAPWIAGIGAAGFAVYKLVKHFKQDAVPAVDLFADKVQTTTNTMKSSNGEIIRSYGQTTVKISEATKKAVGAYMDLDKKATKSLKSLYVNSTKITSKNAADLIKKYNDMGSTITSGMDKDYTERASNMKKFFSTSKTLTDKEEKDILLKMGKSNEAKKAEITKAVTEIKTILDKASKANRELSADEQQQVNALQEKMKTNAIKTLSENELEAKVIMGRIKEYGTRITAEQASEVIKNAEKQRLESVDNANRQYEETKAAIEYMRDETGELTAEQAEKLIEDAEKQRKESIEKANQLKEGVVGKITSMNSEISKSVDTTSGEILKKWDKLKTWWDEWTLLPKEATVKTKGEKTGPIDVINYATGTNSHPGGLAVAGEEGEELVIGPDGQIGLTATTATLYNLPKGTKVIPHGKTKSILSSFNIPGYKDGVGNSNDEKKQGLIDQIENKFSLQYSNLELAMIKLGVNTRTFTEEVKKQQSEIDILNKKLSLMKSEYNEIVKVAGANSDEAISLRNNIASLTVEIDNSTQELKDKISKNAEEAKEKVISQTNDLVERVKSALQEKYQEEERKQEESLQNQLDNLDTWKEKSISKIEEVFDKKLEKLEKDKDLSEKAFEEESNQLDKWKETSIRNIEEVANTKIKSLQAQINALDEQAKADERAAADKEELTKIQRLKDKIEFEHNEFNKAELQKELNNVIAERNKRLHQQEIEDKKDTLSKQIDAVREEAEQQKQSIEDIYSVRKEDLEKRIKESERYFAEQKELIEKNRKDQQEAIEKTYTFQKSIIEKQQKDWKAFYDKKLQDATLQAEAEKLVMDNNQKEIVELLKGYSDNYKEVGETLGEKLVEGFKPKIDSIRQMIADVNSSISEARSNALKAISEANAAKAASSSQSSRGSIHVSNNNSTVTNNNNITFNNPKAMSPSEMLRKTESTLRKLAFGL